jgi:precorrin-6A/cobalt-precorrin-6A reductase
MRLLILGGTTEASALARRIAGRRDLKPVLSFAGRTRQPVPPPIPFRVGGFGGIEGLKTFLAEERTDAVIDATHPFAARMSHHAVVACRDLSLPLAVLCRPAWRQTEVPRRVFLTIGGLQVGWFARAPWHHYIVRTIETPETIGSLPSHRLILARGPFAVEDEINLMRDAAVQVLVSKNSGGAATEGKITAARALGIEVVMVERPRPGEGPCFTSVDAVEAWIDGHRVSAGIGSDG